MLRPLVRLATGGGLPKGNTGGGPLGIVYIAEGGGCHGCVLVALGCDCCCDCCCQNRSLCLAPKCGGGSGDVLDAVEACIEFGKEKVTLLAPV